MPVIQGALTDWSSLYSAIILSSKLNRNFDHSQKTLVSLDLQLYMKCIQLQSVAEINRDFVFRVGELHTVCYTLKFLGKVKNGSGLDLSLTAIAVFT